MPAGKLNRPGAHHIDLGILRLRQGNKSRSGLAQVFFFVNETRVDLLGIGVAAAVDPREKWNHALAERFQQADRRPFVIAGEDDRVPAFILLQ